MFGYVRPPVNALPQEELERFRRMYCGLCHTLSRRYGQAARFILNYDFTYLAILLSSGEDGRRSEARCYTSPLKKRAHLEPDAAMELAADESVILAYWQLRDGVADHGLVSGLKYRAGAGLLEHAYRKAAALRPDFDDAVCRQLGILSELEQENDPSMDRAAPAGGRRRGYSTLGRPTMAIIGFDISYSFFGPSKRCQHIQCAAPLTKARAFNCCYMIYYIRAAQR